MSTLQSSGQNFNISQPFVSYGNFQLTTPQSFPSLIGFYPINFWICIQHHTQGTHKQISGAFSLHSSLLSCTLSCKFQLPHLFSTLWSLSPEIRRIILLILGSPPLFLWQKTKVILGFTLFVSFLRDQSSGMPLIHCLKNKCCSINFVQFSRCLKLES